MIQNTGHPSSFDTTVEVETPERIRFAFRLAGPAQRAAAYGLDLLIRIAVLMAVMIAASLAGFFGPHALAGVGGGVMALALFFVEWGYYMLCEGLMNGQSLGKRALFLRVVRSDGLPIGFTESLLRNLLRAADFLPVGYALGLVVSWLDPRFRRLGDLAASTMVVSERKDRVLGPVVIRPPVQRSELEAIPMRPPLREDELDAIELFLRRAEALNPSREDELAELVAPVFARRMLLQYGRPSRLLGLLYHRARGGAP
ncbi:MAG: RDD family protein [Polyangiaceae bacterium]|nr:RDD family protein [Polyangiaceae bacterium]